MPDISMCPSDDCPVRGDCYRNEASGTRPDSRRQSYSAFTWQQPGGIGSPVECDAFCAADHARAALPPTDQSAGGGR